MAESKQYLKDPNEVEPGWMLIETYANVQGTAYRLYDIASFTKKENVWIEFKREAKNKYDKNAIKVIGCSKGFLGTKHFFLGYVPKQISAVLVNNKLLKQTKPRLRRIWMSDVKDNATIKFQILIKEEYKEMYASDYNPNQ